MNKLEISKAKAEAKKIARFGELSHQQALDKIAKARGYSNWSEALKPAGIQIEYFIIDPEKLSKASHEFYGILIGPYRIAVCLSADGPYITVREKGTAADNNRGVALGHCTRLFRLDQEDVEFGEPGWWICKYGTTEPRAPLTALSDHEAKFVAQHFGFRFEYHPKKYGFGSTNAWKALVEWVAKHPRIAKRYSSTTDYIGDWYGAAIKVNQKKSQKDG